VGGRRKRDAHQTLRALKANWRQSREGLAQTVNHSRYVSLEIIAPLSNDPIVSCPPSPQRDRSGSAEHHDGAPPLAQHSLGGVCRELKYELKSHDDRGFGP